MTRLMLGELRDSTGELNEMVGMLMLRLLRSSEGSVSEPDKISVSKEEIDGSETEREVRVVSIVRLESVKLGRSVLKLRLGEVRSVAREGSDVGSPVKLNPVSELVEMLCNERLVGNVGRSVGKLRLRSVFNETEMLGTDNDVDKSPVLMVVGKLVNEGGVGEGTLKVKDVEGRFVGKDSEVLREGAPIGSGVTVVVKVHEPV